MPVPYGDFAGLLTGAVGKAIEGYTQGTLAAPKYQADLLAVEGAKEEMERQREQHGWAREQFGWERGMQPYRQEAAALVPELTREQIAGAAQTRRFGEQVQPWTLRNMERQHEATVLAIQKAHSDLEVALRATDPQRAQAFRQRISDPAFNPSDLRQYMQLMSEFGDVPGVKESFTELYKATSAQGRILNDANKMRLMYEVYNRRTDTMKALGEARSKAQGLRAVQGQFAPLVANLKNKVYTSTQAYKLAHEEHETALDMFMRQPSSAERAAIVTRASAIKDRAYKDMMADKEAMEVLQQQMTNAILAGSEGSTAALEASEQAMQEFFNQLQTMGSSSSTTVVTE